LLERLLDYWHSIEFFQPSWPVSENSDIDLQKSNGEMPWITAVKDPSKQVSYSVYISCGMVHELITWLLCKLRIYKDDSSIEDDKSKVCICALKLDETGRYIAESFAISSFAWALGVMVKANDFYAKLNENEFKSFNEEFDFELIEKDEVFTLKELEMVYEQVRSRANLDGIKFGISIWANINVVKRNKDGTFPPIEPKTELLSSFYVDDITMVKKTPNEKIKQYAEALLVTSENRIHIDKDIKEMQRWLRADAFPLGVWPSAYSPSLMQQIAINIAISNDRMFSVNGPPGTGKTTLLKEIVVSNVIHRAIEMANFQNPDDAFDKIEYSNPPTDFNKEYYRPHESISQFGILVASNNNKAVENISLELPLAIEKDRTGNFIDTDDNTKTYFSIDASTILGETAWGLISARLGNKPNIGEFKQRFWFSEKSDTLKRFYQDLAKKKTIPPDWNSAVKSFNNAYKAVIEARTDITKAQDALAEYNSCLNAEYKERIKTEELHKSLENQENIYEEQRTKLSQLEEALELHQQNAVRLKEAIPWFMRIFLMFFKNNALVREWKHTEEMCANVLIEVTRQTATLKEYKEKYEAVKLQHASQEKVLIEAINKRARLEAALEKWRELFNDSFADDKYWESIAENERSQSICPWTYEAYDTLREELFYRALMLHKAFILNSKSVYNNIRQLVASWEDNFTKEDRIRANGSLINTLFLVIPVISTTFASVSKFLDGVSQGEIGLLVIDESGQATPQSALGAIWRSKKVIVVGDQLQVEPIMTTPVEFVKRFADEYDIPSMYRIPELLVQRLADAANRYGGIRLMENDEIWLGCPLIVHRRCIEPMFSMSNAIAYNNRMFNKTALPSTDKEFLLDKSIWFDITDSEVGNKDHTVTSQIDLVKELFEKAITLANGFPDLYIITPFRTVRDKLHKELREVLRRNRVRNIILEKLDESTDVNVDDAINDWLKDNVGTIHTFQGKEANEVLLVLGCDSDSGLPAAKWVGQKPNIINVAVSRAKYRIGVIGSYALWRNIPYVQTVCAMLSDSIEVISS